MSAGRRGRGQVWNKAVGRQLYDQGRSYNAIATACGVSFDTVSGYAKRHWPPREADPTKRQPTQPTGERKRTVSKALRRGETTLPPLASEAGSSLPAAVSPAGKV
jgi:transposase